MHAHVHTHLLHLQADPDTGWFLRLQVICCWVQGLGVHGCQLLVDQGRGLLLHLTCCACRCGWLVEVACCAASLGCGGGSTYLCC